MVTIKAIISPLYKKARPAEPRAQAMPLTQSGYTGIVESNLAISFSYVVSE